MLPPARQTLRTRNRSRTLASPTVGERMTSIGDVAAALRTAIATAEQAAASLRAADDRLEGTLTSLHAALAGSSSHDARDGLGSLGAARERLAEALDSLKAGGDRMGEYIAAIAGGGAGVPTPAAPSPGPRRSGPNLARPEFDDRKLTEYALNPKHPVGGGKARVIKSRTGLGLDDAAEVKRQILEKAPAAVPVLGHTDDHGTRWKVDVELTGPDGTMKVRTAWIADAAGKTRLVTISFPPKGER
jgi:hypothetical protein